MKFVIFVGLLLCWMNALQGDTAWKGEVSGGFSAELTLASDEITVPAPIILQAILRYPDSYTPDFSTMRKNLFLQSIPFLASYQLIEEKINEAQANEKGFLTQAVTYALAPLIHGDIPLSLLNISFVPKDAAQKVHVELFSGVLTVHAKPASLVKEGFSNTEFIAPPLPLIPGFSISLSSENRQKFIDNPAVIAQEAVRNEKILLYHSMPWFFVLGVAGLLLCFFGTRQLWTYWKLHAAKKSVIDPRKQALDAISNLQTNYSTLIRQNQGKDFFYQLTTIVRSYLQEAFKIKIDDDTTEELMNLIRQYPSDAPQTSQDIIKFFRMADLVKFSHQIPSKEDCENALALAKGLCKNDLND